MESTTTSRMDFFPISKPFREKVELAKDWIRRRSLKEAMMMDDKIRHIFFTESKERKTNDAAVVETEEDTYIGFYALTPDYADTLDTEKLAVRLLVAAYTLHFFERAPIDTARRLAEEKGQEILRELRKMKLREFEEN
ncbi:MAG: hypothetical protein WC565_01640 [Parcubacteria group bacterium]